MTAGGRSHLVDNGGYQADLEKCSPPSPQKQKDPPAPEFTLGLAGCTSWVPMRGDWAVPPGMEAPGLWGRVYLCCVPVCPSQGH